MFKSSEFYLHNHPVSVADDSFIDNSVVDISLVSDTSTNQDDSDDSILKEEQHSPSHVLGSSVRVRGQQEQEAETPIGLGLGLGMEVFPNFSSPLRKHRQVLASIDESRNDWHEEFDEEAILVETADDIRRFYSGYHQLDSQTSSFGVSGKTFSQDVFPLYTIPELVDFDVHGTQYSSFQADVTPSNSLSPIEANIDSRNGGDRRTTVPIVM